MPPKRKLWIEVSVDLRSHPKLTASAKSLGMPKVHLEGHLVSLWSGALEYAEDGDLWRGDEEKSLRFFESLADIPSDAQRVLDVLRLDRWIDGWLIHDWLDHASRYLINCYSTRNRDRLVEIYAKHNRVYGRVASDNSGITSHGKFWEVNVDNSDLPITYNPKPTNPEPTNPNLETKTLNPCTPKETKKENPGGVGGNAMASRVNSKPRAVFGILYQGPRVPGCAYRQDELTGERLTHKEVFEAFRTILVMHGILTLESFYERVKRSQTTPAAWMMLYLDKIHAIFRNRNGTTLYESEDADPVGMTMAGLIPNPARHKHDHTESARQLFVEIIMDYMKTKDGEKSKWAGRISGPSIALELDRRKGKMGKIA